MPTLYTDLKFDPVKDFQPITALISFNNILVVPAASPAKSVAELVALAKTKPEGLSYGSQGVGTGGHLLGVLFAKHAGIKLVHVPYRGIAPAVTDTVAGRMDMLFASYLSTGGRTSRPAGFGCWRSPARKRHPRIPDVPTMAEAGYPGRADAAMVRPVRAGGHAGADRAEAQRRVRQGAAKRRGAGARCCRRSPSSSPSTPEELGAMVKRDIVRLGQVVKESGAKAPD